LPNSTPDPARRVGLTAAAVVAAAAHYDADFDHIASVTGQSTTGSSPGEVSTDGFPLNTEP